MGQRDDKEKRRREEWRMLWALSLIITASLFLTSCSLGGKRGDGKNLPASTGSLTRYCWRETRWAS